MQIARGKQILIHIAVLKVERSIKVYITFQQMIHHVQVMDICIMLQLKL